MIKGHTKKCREKWTIRSYGFYYCPVHDSIIDWEEDLLEDMIQIWKNEGKTCLYCRHLKDLFDSSCLAFPSVIPSPYLTGYEIHRKSNKYLQKNSIVFQARKKKKSKCPNCGSENVVEIIYGYPLPSTLKKAERGEIHLGGCVVSDNDPQWYCKNCKKEFGRIKRTGLRV